MANSIRFTPLARFGAGLAVYCLLVLVLSVAFPGAAPPALAVVFLGVGFTLSCSVLGHPLRVAPWQDNARIGVLVSYFAAICGIAATTYVLWDAFALLAQYPRPN